MSRNRSCERDMYDILESHTVSNIALRLRHYETRSNYGDSFCVKQKILRDLQKSMAKVLKYIRQPPSVSHNNIAT